MNLPEGEFCYRVKGQLHVSTAPEMVAKTRELWSRMGREQLKRDQDVWAFILANTVIKPVK